ncbi:MAG: murein transglycosylase A [Alphaproteobacteria bacterium]|nr:murein transglycosylase A [Alphaproteobacteria bacterium]
MQKTKIGFWYQQKRVLKFICALLICGLSACQKDTQTPEISGDLRLQPVSFSNLPDWNNEDFAAVIPVFAKNCSQIQKSKNAYFSADVIQIKATDLQEKCKKFTAKNIKTAAEMKKFMEAEFKPYAISDSTNADGKFTSYYEAVIRASYNKSGKYKYPVYGKPSDLIEINLRDFDAELPNTRLVGRVENGKFIPYYNRRDIENNGVQAPVLMWGDDLVDIHFMQIQGSAVAQMDDGSQVRIGFADSNGHKFKGIGSILIAKGYIKSGDSSMPKIREWLRANPDKAEDLMRENDRFIFQRITNADGPVGAFGISLTAGRSMAVDTRYIPLGSMLWLDTTGPDKRSIRKIVFAQDIGSAIKGVVRGDYFWGHGEEALKYAGKMNSAGKYYIIVPKETVLKAN